MTKKQEEALVKRIEDLEKQVHTLTIRAENNQLDKHLYSVVETAELLGKSRQAVYGMIARGEIKTIKMGQIKVLGEELRRILKGEIREVI